MNKQELKNKMIENLEKYFWYFYEAFNASIANKNEVVVYYNPYDESFNYLKSSFDKERCILITAYDIWNDPDYDIDILKEAIEEIEEEYEDCYEQDLNIRELISNDGLFYHLWADEKLRLIEAINQLDI